MYAMINVGFNLNIEFNVERKIYEPLETCITF